MIDEGYVSHANGLPIKLTKERPEQPPIPRDDFKVKAILTNGCYVIPPTCMRYVEHKGKSYAITYHACPREFNMYDENNESVIIYKCSECKMVTWIEVDV